MKPLRTIFFGTHTFARDILASLIDDERIEVVRVVTQPDRPVGRKKVMTPPPAKVLANEHGIVVDQPASLKEYELDAGYDVGIVAQYGNLIPEKLLEGPTHGMINVHTSLLPEYRGASPIQHALLDGKSETGVTIMNMDKGLDTGDILTQHPIAVGPDDMFADVEQSLITEAKEHLVDTVVGYATGDIAPQEQDESKATHCSQLSREDGRIDWGSDAATIYNQYRALTPWPGVWTTWNDKRLKLLSISRSPETIAAGTVQQKDDILMIGTREGSILVHSLQLEGKKEMNATEFLHGFQTFSTSTLE